MAPGYRQAGTSDSARSDGECALPLIEVTPEMVEAGMVELRDHTLAGDLGYMVECLYRAMEYQRIQSLRHVGSRLGDDAI
jgi:hypothetical protein